MSKQALVVGLGQFGSALARSLTKEGVEVLAIDRDEDLVRAIAPSVADAIALDATDERSLARTSPEKRDVCVCAIGNEARDSSIITTALLRQLGATHIAARATDPLHGRILRLVGAHEVVNPEEDFGERYATRLIYKSVVDEIRIGEDLVMTELRVPTALVGRTLASLELPRRFRVTVVAIRRAGTAAIEQPDPMRPLHADDLLLVVAPEGAINQLLEKMS
jgi:trk system potassium uptake protein TrkA